MPSNDQDQVVLGAFASTHGVRGLIKVKPFTDDPLAIAAYGPVLLPDGRSVKITAQGMTKGLVLTSVDGVNSREDADALRGKSFSVSRDKLPPANQDEVYQADLIGCAVHDPELGMVGTVMAIFDFGGGEMLDVKRQHGKSVLLPFGGNNAFSLEDGIITMKVDPVWLEDDSKPSDEDRPAGDTS